MARVMANPDPFPEGQGNSLDRSPEHTGRRPAAGCGILSGAVPVGIALATGAMNVSYSDSHDPYRPARAQNANGQRFGRSSGMRGSLVRAGSPAGLYGCRTVGLRQRPGGCARLQRRRSGPDQPGNSGGLLGRPPNSRASRICGAAGLSGRPFPDAALGGPLARSGVTPRSAGLWVKCTWGWPVWQRRRSRYYKAPPGGAPLSARLSRALASSEF